MDETKRAQIEAQIKEMLDKSVERDWLGGAVGLGYVWLAASMQALLYGDNEEKDKKKIDESENAL